VIGLEFGDVTWQDIDRVNGGKATIPDVPTGTLYLLVAGPDGLIRGTGAEYEYTYYLSPAGTDEVAPFPTILAMAQADSWLAASVAYSGRPRQWRIGNTDSIPHPGWLLVPAD